jgi:hypothetical protein
MKHLFFASLLCAIATGCTALHDTVISSTATTLGVEVSQNPATQLYQAKLGYCRAELAFVPTDRGQATNQIGGAAVTGNVIMELSLRNIFAGGGVYQRLAIGSEAVAQPGAIFMFAKDQNGQISTNTAAIIQQNLPLMLNRPTKQ